MPKPANAASAHGGRIGAKMVRENYPVETVDVGTLKLHALVALRDAFYNSNEEFVSVAESPSGIFAMKINPRPAA